MPHCRSAIGNVRPMTDLDPDTAPRFKDLMASVGFFIFCWGQLELTLNRDIGRRRRALELRVGGLAAANIKVQQLDAVTLTGRIGAWQRLVRAIERDVNLHLVSVEIGEEIANLRFHRNVVAHGLSDGDAGSRSEEGRIVCVERGEKSAPRSKRIYSKSDLDQLAQSADRCQRGIRSLHNWTAVK